MTSRFWDFSVTKFGEKRYIRDNLGDARSTLAILLDPKFVTFFEISHEIEEPSLKTKEAV